MNDAGIIVITAFISPYAEDREMARAVIGPERFLETYLAADVATCERRDPKGLYAKARSGEIVEFTGVTAPYQPPTAPDVVLETGQRGVDECVTRLLAVIAGRFV
jgi:adenylylsulfate kinase